MKKKQSSRLTQQHRKSGGVAGIFGEEAQYHDKEVSSTSRVVLDILKAENPNLKFRYRKEILKREINETLNRYDDYIGQTLFVENASIKPDGGIIEILDDNGNWRIVLVSEAKHQGKDIDNIRKGHLVGKNSDQDLMVAGNAIERAHKNIMEIANYMMFEPHFPYVLFLEGSNFLTHDVTVTRPDGRVVVLPYNAGSLNRLDRLTASNYGMPINTNLCIKKKISYNGMVRYLSAVSIFTQCDGEHWNDEDMIKIMLEIARTSIYAIQDDLINQIYE